jgi:predicted transcriptional regulator
MSATIKKDDAHRLIDLLPENSTWEDLMREIYVREAIENGLADSKAGRTKDISEIENKYGLTE